MEGKSTDQDKLTSFNASAGSDESAQPKVYAYYDFDADGHIYTLVYRTARNTKKNEKKEKKPSSLKEPKIAKSPDQHVCVQTNQTYFDGIFKIAKNENYAGGWVGSASFRTTIVLDEYNSFFNGTGLFFKDLEKIFRYFQQKLPSVIYDEFSLAEAYYHDRNDVKNYLTKARKYYKYKKENQRKMDAAPDSGPQTYDNFDDVLNENEKFPYAFLCIPTEYDKLILVLCKLQRFACLLETIYGPDAVGDYHFGDDKGCILQTVFTFLSKYPQCIPRNIRKVRLHHGYFDHPAEQLTYLFDEYVLKNELLNNPVAPIDYAYCESVCDLTENVAVKANKEQNFKNENNTYKEIEIFVRPEENDFEQKLNAFIERRQERLTSEFIEKKQKEILKEFEEGQKKKEYHPYSNTQFSNKSLLFFSTGGVALTGTLSAAAAAAAVELVTSTAALATLFSVSGVFALLALVFLIITIKLIIDIYQSPQPLRDNIQHAI